MTSSKTRRLIITLAIVLIISVICLALPVFMQGAQAATGDNADVIGKLYQTTHEGDLLIDGGVLRGINPDIIAANDDIALVIPDTVSEIAEEAFKDVWQITTVTLPDKQLTFGNNAFENCGGIAEVRDLLTGRFGADTGVSRTDFGGLLYSALSLVEGDAETSLFVDGGYLFCLPNRDGTLKGKLQLICYLGDDLQNGLLTLPAGSYDVYQYAFWNGNDVDNISRTKNDGIVEVDMSGAEIQTIGRYAFYHCANLTAVVMSESTTVIGESAFQGCTKLETAELPDNLVTIGNFAFDSCVSLDSSVKIASTVTTIGQNAFFNCRNVTTLTFDGSATEPSLTVDSNAFNGTGLTVAELPARISRINTAAFANTNITTVYMQSGVTYGTTIGANTGYFPMTATLIFDNFDNYKSGTTTANLNVHADQMTYLVDVVFNGGEGEGKTFTMERLAGRSYGFVRQGSGAWDTVGAEAISALLPTQAGYAVSVWYSTVDFNDENPVKSNDVSTITSISNRLADEWQTAAPEITYYAAYVEKPDFKAANLTYDEERTYGATDLLANANALFNGERMGIKVDTAEESVSNRYQQAGDYAVTVSLLEKFGQWANDIVVNVTIQRKAVQINNLEFSGLEKGVMLVYVYSKDSDNTDRRFFNALLSDAQIPEGYSFAGLLGLYNSVALHNGELITIDLTSNAYTVSFATYGTTSTAEAGMHTATATLTANKNYRLVSSGQTNVNRGLTVELAADGLSAEITKVWYILEVNSPIFISGTQTPYQIVGWTYNSSAPLIYVPELTNGNTLTFTLKLNGESIADDKEISVFGNYVNASMPAGTYTLTLQVTDGQMPVYSADYTFVVAAAKFNADWASDAESKLVNAGWALSQDNDQVQLQVYGKTGAHSVDLAVWKATDLNPERTGFWALAEQDCFYDDEFELTYYLSAMTGNSYVNYNTLAALTVAPKNVGTYVVYYQLSANNYVSLVNEADVASRNAHSFEVVIYDYLPVPTVPSSTYNGQAQFPNVPSNAHYTVTFDSKGYTDVKSYALTLTSNDPTHYKWKNGNSDVTAITVQYVIERADNTLYHLSIPSWNYGYYNDKDNAISFSARFGTEADVSYELRAANGDKYVFADFKNVPAGIYTLVAIVKGYDKDVVGTENYNWNAREFKLDNINIAVASNSWLQTPNVMRWRYGQYNKDANLIVAEAALKDTPVKFTITKGDGTAIEGLAGFETVNGVVQSQAIIDILSSLPVGTYRLYAVVAGTDDYAELRPEPHEFRIIQGVNSWAKDPELNSWVEGKFAEADNSFTGEARFGNGSMTIVIRSVDNPELVIYDTANGIDKRNGAPVGSYILTATVAETADYEALSTTFTFSVFQKAGMPWWGTVLIVFAVLGLAALLLALLHQKGVLQILSGAIYLAVRNKATVDATIAAVRANKVAEESKLSVARARAADAREARKQAIIATRAMSADEQAAQLEQKAQEHDEVAIKYNKRAESIRSRAEKLRNQLQSAADEQSQQEETAEQTEDTDQVEPKAESVDPTVTAEPSQSNPEDVSTDDTHDDE